MKERIIFLYNEYLQDQMMCLIRVRDLHHYTASYIHFAGMSDRYHRCGIQHNSNREIQLQENTHRYYIRPYSTSTHQSHQIDSRDEHHYLSPYILDMLHFAEEREDLRHLCH